MYVGAEAKIVNLILAEHALVTQPPMLFLVAA